MMTHLLSFLGVEDETALVIDDEVRPLRSFVTALPKSNEFISGIHVVCGNAIRIHSNA